MNQVFILFDLRNDHDDEEEERIDEKVDLEHENIGNG